MPAFPEAAIGTRRLLLTPLGRGDASGAARALVAWLGRHGVHALRSLLSDSWIAAV